MFACDKEMAVTLVHNGANIEATDNVSSVWVETINRVKCGQVARSLTCHTKSI
jgi:hypothetical protein